LTPKVRYTDEQKQLILRAYHQRSSLRGVQRLFGVSRPTLIAWIKKVHRLPAVQETLAAARADDVLEIDAMWSYVGKRGNRVWLWSALCRRTRQIVAFGVGDWGEATCQRLWEALLEAYRSCVSYRDGWSAYAAVFPAATHRCVAKGSGELSHLERWHATVRPRLSGYVRKTLSFSKSLELHELVTRWFIVEYNQSLSLNT
jgi:insertion element IS1 protein InsB